LPPTSAIMPRPNWAGLPVMDRSVATVPLVWSPSWVSVMVTVAFTVPLPRESLAAALSTARRACSSRSVNVPVPLYSSTMGPTFTFMVPVNESPSTPVRVAPGMHGATRSGSSSAPQTTSIGAGTDT
jgi:hypothetical protein